MQTSHQLGHRSLLRRSFRPRIQYDFVADVDVACFLSPGATPNDGGTFRAMDAVILDDEIAPALAAAPVGFELSADVLPAMRAARGEMFAAQSSCPTRSSAPTTS